MGTNSTRVSVGTYQYADGNNTAFAGAETRFNFNKGYVGAAGYVATNNLETPYTIVDAKGKLNYDNNGICEQNLRVRTALGKNTATTQFRYSPLTVNVPINKNLSIYTNTHYSGKYNYNTKEWNHSLGNFTGVSWDINKHNNICLEGQRYNLQNLKDNSGGNWGINLIYSYKF